MKLLQHKKTELPLLQLYSICEELNNELRKKNNTIIIISTNNVYESIENYHNFFQIDNDIIKLSRTSRNSYFQDNREFVNILDSYFYAGIPSDIKSTIINKLTNMLIE